MKKTLPQESNFLSCYYSFFYKICNKKKILNEQFNLCETKICLDRTIKSTNSQLNNKFLGNDGLAAKLYKHFFNEQALVLLSF